MKEIQKVVQKLSREQESATGGGGGGGGAGVRTGTKNMKSPPVYRGDLIIILWLRDVSSNHNEILLMRKESRCLGGLLIRRLMWVGG